MTNQPLRKAMGRPDIAARMVQWAVELSQFDINYRPRTAIKARALADFVVEFTVADQDLESDYWTMYIDGLLASSMGGVGVILLSPKKYIIKYIVQLQFLATNNEAEYETVLTSLRVAKALGVRNLKLNEQQIRGQRGQDEEVPSNK